MHCHCSCWLQLFSPHLSFSPLLFGHLFSPVFQPFPPFSSLFCPSKPRTLSHPFCYSSPPLPLSHTQDKIQIIASDPLTAECFTLSIEEDVSSMPMGEQVASILLPFKQYTDRVLNSVHSSRHHLCVGGEDNLLSVYLFGLLKTSPVKEVLFLKLSSSFWFTIYFVLQRCSNCYRYQISYLPLHALPESLLLNRSILSSPSTSILLCDRTDYRARTLYNPWDTPVEERAISGKYTRQSPYLNFCQIPFKILSSQLHYLSDLITNNSCVWKSDLLFCHRNARQTPVTERTEPRSGTHIRW